MSSRISARANGDRRQRFLLALSEKRSARARLCLAPLRALASIESYPYCHSGTRATPAVIESYFKSQPQLFALCKKLHFCRKQKLHLTLINFTCEANFTTSPLVILSAAEESLLVLLNVLCEQSFSNVTDKNNRARYARARFLIII